jgi:hypothetical protein
VNIKGTGHKMKIKPIKRFSYWLLKDWLAQKLSLPGFEKLLDSSLQKKNSLEGRMADVWDGSVWKSFIGPQNSNETFTSKSGHLVFSLYVDWFNPYGNKVGGKSLSLGAVELVYLNLPIDKWYKIENIYVSLLLFRDNLTKSTWKDKIIINTLKIRK